MGERQNLVCTQWPTARYGGGPASAVNGNRHVMNNYGSSNAKIPLAIPELSTSSADTSPNILGQLQHPHRHYYTHFQPSCGVFWIHANAQISTRTHLKPIYTNFALDAPRKRVRLLSWNDNHCTVTALHRANKMAPNGILDVALHYRQLHILRTSHRPRTGPQPKVGAKRGRANEPHSFLNASRQIFSQY